MLGAHDLVAFVPITDPDRAIAFYRDQLGLGLIEEQKPFAIVFDAHGTAVRATLMKQVTPAQFTVLGWRVPDIRAAVQELSDKGVAFERFPPMPQDDLGIWTAPGGTQVAWFKDPDGNILSLQSR